MKQLSRVTRYFNNDLTDFTIPLDLSRYSPALIKWLSVLSTIPFGYVITYKEFAMRWGNIKAAKGGWPSLQT